MNRSDAAPDCSQGGENEILVLAEHFKVEVTVVSCESMTTLTYGEGQPNGRVHILYTGQHYDPLVGVGPADRTDAGPPPAPPFATPATPATLAEVPASSEPRLLTCAVSRWRRRRRRRGGGPSLQGGIADGFADGFARGSGPWDRRCTQRGAGTADGTAVADHQPTTNPHRRHRSRHHGLTTGTLLLLLLLQDGDPTEVRRLRGDAGRHRRVPGPLQRGAGRPTY